jgi:hypothetical protein
MVDPKLNPKHEFDLEFPLNAIVWCGKNVHKLGREPIKGSFDHRINGN